MKYLVTFLAIAFLAVTAYGYNVAWGIKVKSDPLLFKQHIFKPDKISHVQELIFKYPAAKALTNPRTISTVRVFDNTPFQSGGASTLSEGGPNFKMVTLMMKSQQGLALNLTVEIYGRNKK